jgi:hypothetical protein
LACATLRAGPHRQHQAQQHSDLRQPSAAAYDLAKLRAKRIVTKQLKSQRYHPSANGLQALAALLVITDKVVRPVLAGAGKPRPGRSRKTENPLEIHYSALHYSALHSEMWKLFGTLGIAA